jgi:hypothetical protein
MILPVKLNIRFIVLFVLSLFLYPEAEMEKRKFLVRTRTILKILFAGEPEQQKTREQSEHKRKLFVHLCPAGKIVFINSYF